MRRGRVAREFGWRVRALREDLGISQEKLGERTDLHRNYIGCIERGECNPSLININRLAKAFGLSLTELFEGVRS